MTQLTTEDIKRIPELRKEGKNNTEIAQILNCSKFTIAYWCKILKKKGYELAPAQKGRKTKLVL